MGSEINRSCTAVQARQLKELLLASGAVEAHSQEEVRRLESRGKTVFIDHTKNGAESFSEAEMDDFRNTPIGEFSEHQRRWGH